MSLLKSSTKNWTSKKEEKVVVDISEASPENINTSSIQSKVNLEKDMTLQVQISKKVDEEGTQQSAENVKIPLAHTSPKEPDSTKASVSKSRSFVTESSLAS